MDSVKSATYAPQGDIRGYKAGNTSGFAGINVSNAYNARLQPSVFSADVVGGNTLRGQVGRAG